MENDINDEKEKENNNYIHSNYFSHLNCSALYVNLKVFTIKKVLMAEEQEVYIMGKLFNRGNDKCYKWY